MPIEAPTATVPMPRIFARCCTACWRAAPSPGSPRLAAFLRFVVEETLAGHSERLKDYTIAVDALGCSPDFNPETDAIVRVHAYRVRRALVRYYETEGMRDPVVIELPSRHYVPTFENRERTRPHRLRHVDVPPGTELAIALELCRLLGERTLFNNSMLKAEIGSLSKTLAELRRLLGTLIGMAAPRGSPPPLASGAEAGPETQEAKVPPVIGAAAPPPVAALKRARRS